MNVINVFIVLLISIYIVNAELNLIETKSTINANPKTKTPQKDAVADAKKKVLSKSPTASTTAPKVQSKLQVYTFGADGKPWSMTMSGDSLTLSWIGFSLIVVVSCVIGASFGYKSRGDSKSINSSTLNVNTDAYDVYV